MKTENTSRYVKATLVVNVVLDAEVEQFNGDLPLPISKEGISKALLEKMLENLLGDGNMGISIRVGDILDSEAGLYDFEEDIYYPV